MDCSVVSKCSVLIMRTYQVQNQSLRANRTNFNLDHRINIQEAVGLHCRWPKLKFARFARKDWFAPDTFPLII